MTARAALATRAIRADKPREGMESFMLQLSVIGNLGSDPEMRYTANGTPTLRFNVAGNYRVRGDDGEWTDKAEWIRVTLFGTRAESLSQFLRKGTKIYAQGRVEARPWTDREGNPRAGLEMIGDTLELLSPREQGEQRPPQQSPGTTVGRRPTDDDPDELEDLPF